MVRQKNMADKTFILKTYNRFTVSSAYTFIVMNIDSLSYWNKVGAIVAKFPGAEAGSSYGTPAFNVNKKLFVRLKENGKTIVVFTNERDKWMKQQPETFFITDHYKNYPMMLIDMVTVKNKELERLLLASWQLKAGERLLQEIKKTSLKKGLP